MNKYLFLDNFFKKPKHYAIEYLYIIKYFGKHFINFAFKITPKGLFDKKIMRKLVPGFDK
jgi:hypothetical protein